VLHEIEPLDAERDHQRIAFLTCRVDFPWDTTRALEFALFRTFCAPRISGLLDRTKEFECRAQKRYDDTDIIVSEIMEHGYDSERGRAAIARMNALHGHFQIGNEEFLYVLSTFVFEPIRWNARFGWRRMIEKERLALFHFWRAVGKRMNIKDIPTDYAAFERFSVEYERAHYRFSEANRRVGTATRELFKSWFPRWLRPLVERGIHGFMDEPLLVAFGFPKPSPVMRWAVEATLKLRGRFLRVAPRRRCPVLRTQMAHASYPNGYTIERVGPPLNEPWRSE
jgi:ER-bound oxygenase mpaB/B'/Rubber oxygenase, catalytic domain